MTQTELSDLCEVQRCPICGAHRQQSIGRCPTIHPRSELQVEVKECLTCAHWYVTPIPSQAALSALYQAGSGFVVSSGWQGMKTSLSVPEQFVVKRELTQASVAGDGGPRSYLECGVGDGLLLRQFERAGWDCTGIDPGPVPSWTQGTRVRMRTSLDELSSMSADVLVMADVLEHVVDPAAMLATAARFAHGTIYMSFPNKDSLRAKLQRVNWRMVRPLGHLHFFSQQSLQVLLSRAGLDMHETLKTDLVSWPIPLTLRMPIQLGMYCVQSVLGDQWVVSCRRQSTRGA